MEAIIITAIFAAIILLCVLEEGMKNGNIYPPK